MNYLKNQILTIIGILVCASLLQAQNLYFMNLLISVKLTKVKPDHGMGSQGPITGKTGVIIKCIFHLILL